MYATSFVDLPTGRLAYHDARPTSGAQTHPALLLVHGWAGDKALWWDALDLLGTDHRCLAPDLPGHGESAPATAGLAPADFARTLADFVAALAVTPIVVVAHSYGCFVALHLALARPDLVLGLVLSNPPHPERGVWSARAWVNTRLETPALAIARRLNAWAGRDAPPTGGGMLGFSRRRWQAAGHLSMPVLSTTLRGIYDPDLTGRLDAIAAPTLVVAGRWDVTAPATGARALATAVPGAALHVIPRASHHPMAEAPGAFAEVVRAFTREVAQTATTSSARRTTRGRPSPGGPGEQGETRR